MSKRLLFFVAILAAIGAIWLTHHDQDKVNQQVKIIQAADAATQSTVSTIQSLKNYIAGHMGTSAKFTLTGQYNRDVAAAQAAALVQAQNSQIYAAAQRLCSGKADSIVQAKCNAAYLQAHLVPIPASAPLTAPNLTHYSYNFQSPFWTPSMAGALWVGALVALAYIGLLWRRHR